MEKPQELPNDVGLLKQIIEEQRARLVTHKVEIEQLRLELAKLKRLKFGRSSERLDARIAQLELTLEELEVSAAPVLAIESINMSLRKVIKTRASFPTDDAVNKLFYLALNNISKKWTMPLRDWKAALNRFTIQFEERMKTI